MAGPHDALFRATLTDPENAIAELRRVLPAALVEQLDFTSLRLLPGHFVDSELEESESDLLFSIAAQGCDLLVYVLVEHQSTVDKTMTLRLLRYMTRAWQQYLKEHPDVHRVPPIVPVVVHHSASGWTAPTGLRELLDVPESLWAGLAEHLPDFRFILHDLAREDLDALRRAALPAHLKVVLFLLQRTRNNPSIGHELAPWSEVVSELAEDALTLVMSYILSVTDADPRPIGRWAHRVGRRAEEAYVTAAEKIAQQAAQKAARQERAKALVEVRLEMVRKQLKRRFGELPEHVEQRLRSADAEQLDGWALKLLDAPSLEDVFT